MTTPEQRQTVPKDGQPYGWIQWKGTNVCMDFHCECGSFGHVDADFTYHLRCPDCGATFLCNPHVELVKLTSDEAKAAMCVVDVPPEEDES